MIPDTKPTYNGNRKCDLCGKSAVSLDSENCHILWCEYGHVTIVNPSTKELNVKVYEF